MSGVPSFWSSATSWPVVRRALAFAIVVGPILIAINHGDRLLAGDVDTIRLLKMSLTFLVPYAVSTLSSVAALRNEARRATGATEEGRVR